MAVVAQTIPEDADADCSGLIEELSIKLWDGVVGVGCHIRNPTSRFVNSGSSINPLAISRNQKFPSHPGKAWQDQHECRIKIILKHYF
jgi:hypothetical protein